MAFNDSKFEVVVINDFAHINGGAAKVAIESACGLAESGVPVSFFSAVKPVEERLFRAGVHVVCLDEAEIASEKNRFKAFIQGIWNRNAAVKIAELLSHKSPSNTIVHVHGWTKALSSSVVKAPISMGFQVVVTLHDYFSVCPNGGLFEYPAQKVCMKRPLSLDCIICNCDVRHYSHKLWRVARQWVQKYFGRLPDGIEHFIYLTDFSLEKMQCYLPGKATYYRVSNPIDLGTWRRDSLPDTPRFVFAGRLSAEKGIHIFAQAVSELGMDGVIVGDGPLRSELQEKYPKLRFTGWLSPEEVYQQMTKSSALVFPSQCYETQGLVVQEAAALGVPSVVSDECAAIDFVEDGVNGIHFKSGDPDSLAKVLNELASNGCLVQRLGQNALEKSSMKSPDLVSHIESLMAVYDQVSRQRRAA